MNRELIATQQVNKTQGITHLPPGLHPGIADSLYHTPCLELMSNSGLGRFRRSPAHYRAWALRQTTEPESTAFAFGKALHCAVLEPERFAHEFVTEPEWGDCRKTENKKARDAWREAHAGVTLLSDTDATSLRGMIESVLAHPLARRCIERGASEVTLRWRDASGAECKGRIDYHVPEIAMAVDLKTTEDASPNAFRRSVASYGYHRQDAFYRRGLAAVNAGVEHFAFVAIEKTPPYAVAIYTIDPAAIAAAHEATTRLLERFAECLAWDDWPSLSHEIQTLQLPPWVTE
jgi:hypothetical protein